ncbi:hypothetical protein [Pseudomonas fluorescens]|uniref:hypothetical protein n=1 Tax=Pseudomonas fluorescens TaxID=294 RepID=UPI0005FB8E1D|nr:hypothetical protein [Pseudomonas fluorescens]KJZ41309.1 hypothetical protein VC33_00210 [Pseudomonas fluorescens]
MKTTLLLAALCGLSFECMAQGVVLNGEYGCQSRYDQQARAALIVDLRSFAPEDIVRQEPNKAALKALNESKCLPLTGQFTLLQEADGLRQVESATGKFWLAE